MIPKIRKDIIFLNESALEEESFVVTSLIQLLITLTFEPNIIKLHV